MRHQFKLNKVIGDLSKQNNTFYTKRRSQLSTPYDFIFDHNINDYVDDKERFIRKNELEYPDYNILVDKEALSKYLDFNFKPKPKTSTSVERPHKTKDLSNYIKQVFKTNIKIKEVIQIMQELIDSGIDYRVLYFLRQHIQKEIGYPETISLNYFRKLWNSLINKEISYANPVVEQKLLHLITDEKGESVSTSKLTKIIELTEFFPFVVKKDKNYSQELYYVLNPNINQPGHYTGTESTKNLIEINELKQKSLIEFLCSKLDEKFYKVADAFCHFDVENKTYVSKRDFRDGLERLKIKISEDDLNTAFNLLDRNKTGYFNYNDFCFLYQDKTRLGISESAKSIEPIPEEKLKEFTKLSLLNDYNNHSLKHMYRPFFRTNK